jgi:hypothetical protein
VFVLGHTLFSQKVVVFSLDARFRLQFNSTLTIPSFRPGETALLRVDSRPVSPRIISPIATQDLVVVLLRQIAKKCLSADNNVSFPNAGFAHPPLLA